MNTKTAEVHLPLYRAGQRVDSRTLKAVRVAECDPVLRQKLSDQMDFDDQMVDVIHFIRPPDDLRQKLSELTARAAGAERLKIQIAHPAILSALAGVLLIVGFLIYLEIDSRRNFPGREAVQRMLAETEHMTGVEFEPTSSPAGQLSDWFFMHGFDSFVAGPDLAALPAVGARVFKQNGQPIAQLAIDRQNAILFSFRAADFGVNLGSDGDWNVFEREGWVAAIRAEKGICTMVAFRGTKSEMKGFVEGLKP